MTEMRKKNLGISKYPAMTGTLLALMALAGLMAVAMAAVACGGETEVVEKIVTVEVEKPVTVTEKVVETVIVEKMVEGKTVMEVQTVVVDRPVTVIEKVVETVIVEKMVEGKTVMEVQTVIVEKPVTVTEKVVETVVVEKMVEGKTVMEVQTVIVEKPVTVTEKVVETVVVEKMVIVEKPVTVVETVVVERQVVQWVVQMEEGAPKGTIVFSDLNWTSAQVQNRIAQYILENGYGYPTDVVFGATLPNFQGFQRGDIHVTMEIWLPNQSIGWEKAIEIGDVVSVGTSLVGDWQSTFVIPKYVADANPGLKTPQDLLKPEYQELFSTADSRGNARLVACVIGWACEVTNTEQIEAYGLTDAVHVISAGSQEAMFAEVYAAYEKEEPWLGYMWGTGDPGLKLDLVRLEEAPYTKECWDTDKACAFAESLVLVAVHKSLLPRAPDVVAMLQNWEFSIDIYKSIFQWMDANPGSEASEAAVWFLNNNKVWESWVTPEAAAKVNAALGS